MRPRSSTTMPKAAVGYAAAFQNTFTVSDLFSEGHRSAGSALSRRCTCLRHVGAVAHCRTQERTAMKRSDRRAGLITAALAALTFGTYGQITFAATDGESTHETRKETTTGRTAATPCEEQASSANSPLTLLIQPPVGSTVRLTYVPADGWKLDTPDAAPKATQGRVTPVGTSR